MPCRAKDVATHPEKYPHTQGRRGIGGARADLGGQYFRSAWEANYARYLNLLRERGQIGGWLFEPDTFEFPVKRGSRFYTPDFKVTSVSGDVCYHEVKGYMDPRSATKLRRMAKYYPAVLVELIDKTRYRAIAETAAVLIPTWETCRSRAARAD